MIVYGIVIIPLIRNLKQAIHDVTHPWYADNIGALGTFERLETYFDLPTLARQPPGRGYHPQLTNIVLIVHPKNIESGKLLGAHHGFRVCIVAHYLGDYIGDDESKRDWLRECMLTWEKNTNRISKTTGKYPYTSYDTVVHAIQ